MSNIFKDNLRASIILGIIAFCLTPVPVLGAIVGIFGFYKGRAAVAQGKYLAFLGVILSLIPILYLLITLFFLGYLFTKR